MQRDDKREIVETQSREVTERSGGRFSRRRQRWLKAGLRPSPSPQDEKVRTASATRSSSSEAERVGQLTHSVASLVANPSSVSEIPLSRIPALVAELASEQSALSALQGALTTRLLVSQANAAAQPEPTDRLMTAEEVATTLGVTKRWVQRRARRLPFARRISDHAIRYSEAGLKRWMSNRKLSAA
jgi:predicted DNA-binding transcriptional regulator AlpA